jgi:hypothetical protein
MYNYRCVKKSTSYLVSKGHKALMPPFIVEYMSISLPEVASAAFSIDVTTSPT